MKLVTHEEFMNACDAIWTEISYQDALARRSENEAKDVQGFATLGRVYIRKLEDDWAMNAGDELALHDLRKLAAIFVRGMTYCGIRDRVKE